MSVPALQDAALRWTENSQTFIHNLAAKLENVRESSPERVYGSVSADGSTVRRVAIPSTAKDLHATVRFDGGPHQLLEFIRAGRRGATIEYFPSLANPSESYPCVLMDATDPEPDGRLSFTYSSDLVLRRTDGGTWLGVIGGEPLFYWRAGNPLPGLTFTRSGTVGPYTDSDGLLKSAAADILRTEWTYENGGPLPDTPWSSVESPAFTNLVTSDDILNDWGVINTPVVTASISDPADGTGAFTVADDDGAVEEVVTRAVTYTGDGVKTVVFVVRENTMASSGNQNLRLTDTTAGPNRASVDITAWVAGEPTLSVVDGVLLGKRYVGSGYWAIYVQTTSVTAANGHQVRISPARTAAATGAIDVYRVNAYDSPQPIWSILDASETKAAETFFADFVHAPQAMCGMVDFRELEAPTFLSEGGASRRILHIGDAGNLSPRFAVLRTGPDLYQAFHGVGGLAVTATVDVNPVWGDRVQLFWWLYPDGSVDIAGRRQALGSETWSSIATTTQSGALPLASAWSDERMYFGSVGSVGRGSQLYRANIMLPGNRTTTELLAA